MDYPTRCYRCMRIVRRFACRWHRIGSYPVLVCKDRGACTAAMREVW